MDKPKIFIGSSKEGLPIANAVFVEIQCDVQPTIWDQGLFLPGQYAFETLEEQLANHDFAILIASPDDELTKRGKSTLTMRDNVLLEFGLFAGVLGRKRTFLMIPKSQELNIPSDILGIMPVTYDDKIFGKNESQTQIAVRKGCSLILKAIQKECLERDREIEEFNLGIRKSEKVQAIKRIYNVAIQLRDAIMVLQKDVLEAISDCKTFEKVKKKAISATQQVFKDLYNDAEEIGITDELTALVNSTKDAIQDLPFPRELSMNEREIGNKAINIGESVLSRILNGGNVIDEVKRTAGNEIEKKISSLKRRFSKWWSKYYPEIHSKTIKLQDALFKASMDVAFDMKRF